VFLTAYQKRGDRDGIPVDEVQKILDAYLSTRAMPSASEAPLEIDTIKSGLRRSIKALVRTKSETELQVLLELLSSCDIREMRDAVQLRQEYTRDDVAHLLEENFSLQDRVEQLREELRIEMQKQLIHEELTQSPQAEVETTVSEAPRHPSEIVLTPRRVKLLKSYISRVHTVANERYRDAALQSYLLDEKTFLPTFTPVRGAYITVQQVLMTLLRLKNIESSAVYRYGRTRPLHTEYWVDSIAKSFLPEPDEAYTVDRQILERLGERVDALLLPSEPGEMILTKEKVQIGLTESLIQLFRKLPGVSQPAQAMTTFLQNNFADPKVLEMYLLGKKYSLPDNYRGQLMDHLMLLLEQIAPEERASVLIPLVSTERRGTKFDGSTFWHYLDKVLGGRKKVQSIGVFSVPDLFATLQEGLPNEIHNACLPMTTLPDADRMLIKRSDLGKWLAYLLANYEKGVRSLPESTLLLSIDDMLSNPSWYTLGR